jgi:hypothetical protein
MAVEAMKLDAITELRSVCTASTSRPPFAMTVITQRVRASSLTAWTVKCGSSRNRRRR